MCLLSATIDTCLVSIPKRLRHKSLADVWLLANQEPGSQRITSLDIFNSRAVFLTPFFYNSRAVCDSTSFAKHVCNQYDSIAATKLQLGFNALLTYDSFKVKRGQNNPRRTFSEDEGCVMGLSVACSEACSDACPDAGAAMHNRMLQRFGTSFAHTLVLLPNLGAVAGGGGGGGQSDILQYFTMRSASA